MQKQYFYSFLTLVGFVLFFLADCGPVQNPPPKHTTPTPTPTPTSTFTGTTPLVIQPPPFLVNSLAWSPDNTRIVSGSFDGSVGIWDLARNSLILTYHGHTGAVNAVAWSPDGTRIASAGRDGSIRLWRSDGHRASFVIGRFLAEIAL